MASSQMGLYIVEGYKMYDKCFMYKQSNLWAPYKCDEQPGMYVLDMF